VAELKARRRTVNLGLMGLTGEPRRRTRRSDARDSVVAAIRVIGRVRGIGVVSALVKLL
jgi:hypothetical protein